MKFSFRKRPVARQAIQPEALGVKISRYIKTYQLKAAGYLQQKSEKLSLKMKWTILAIFCLLMCSISICLIAGKFYKPGATASISINRIKLPVQPEQLRPHSSGISKTEFEKIMAFKIYMDSLARAPGGLQEFERINQTHPGLLDSIKTIEQIYQSQFKN